MFDRPIVVVLMGFSGIGLFAGVIFTGIGSTSLFDERACLVKIISDCTCQKNN